ncbi:MAG: SOS response-associated peptidase family protein [Bdellovibrionales bacterium]|nr:SOS response-associated peptidase family protein [Bdellovibrionales bacterium]
MCAQYIVKLQALDLETLFGISISNDIPPWLERITPYTSAPVLTHDGLHMMNFSLIPSWATEKKQKFATYNARIETVIEKPTWRKPFEANRCLVPISKFVEPIYEHEYAGNMVAFERKDHEPLFAAGIYDHWIDKKTGEEIASFAILTSPALEFVHRIGHDRSPIFLPKESFTEWTKPEKQNPQKLVQYLREHRLNPPLIVEKDRPMKAGWEKRKPQESNA